MKAFAVNIHHRHSGEGRNPPSGFRATSIFNFPRREFPWTPACAGVTGWAAVLDILLGG
jgi:hypothetical protein